jgi:hypothetical protein
VKRAGGVTPALAARAVTRPAHSTAALQRSCALAAAAESASQFAAPPQQQCRGSQAGCASDVTRGWRRAVHRAAERSRALPQCTAAERSAALRAAERSRGDCRARPSECVGRPGAVRAAAIVLLRRCAVVGTVARHSRSASAVASEPAPPWYALMAIRRAPNVRGLRLRARAARACARKVINKIH